MRKFFFAVLALCLAPLAFGDVLLVVGQVPVSTGDAALVSRLQSLGHTVTVVGDAASTTASANGKALVVISETVNSGAVGNKFNQVSVPIVVFEPWVYDNLGLTGPLASTDYGFTTSQRQLRMTGTHPLTAGLSGNVTVGSSGSSFSWGIPGNAAVIAATLRNDATRPTIFGYESGAQLANGLAAPARRVALHLNTGTTTKWNANGQNLFGAAVQWALGSQPSPNQPPSVNAGTDTAAIVGVALALNGSVSDDGVALPLTTSWGAVAGASFSNASSPSASVTFASPGTYQLVLTANDTQFTASDAVTVTVASASQGKQVLLIVGRIPVTNGDAALISRLQSLDHAVTVVGDAAGTTASANGKDLVVISESVNSSGVENKFNQVSVPVIVFEPWLYDNLGLTGAVASTDYGFTQNQTQLRMTGTHPLTAGLTGNVTVGNAASSFSWGVPGGTAIVAATLRNDATRPTIFGYEAGAQLANGTAAPARRVALHPNAGTTTSWNANGQSLFSAAVQWSVNGSAPPAVARILPLGDSITQGRTDHWSYRRNLETALNAADCTFDLVGNEFGPASGPGSALVDRDHEGHSGFRTDQIRAGLAGWLSGNEPDWVLVHVGTNDVLQGTSISAAITNIGVIIDLLRDANANVGILLAQVIPNRPANEAAVAALNDGIVTLAAQKNLPSTSPVIVVDHYSGYSTFTHNYDEVHPNDAGEALMAQRWAQALLPRIAESCGP